jgi:putative ABC transport system ATP-binding protein
MSATLEQLTMRNATRVGLALEARGVTKHYGRGDSAVRALRGVDVQIKEAETIAIMGPSGCGKTTLLHLLGGIERPDGGEVLFGGAPIPKDEQNLAELHRHTVCFVFQGFGLIPSLSAEENVEFPLMTSGVATAERKERAAAALRDVGLTDWRNHLPEELSGGQRQRVAIARALAPRPKLILADEPTGNLDTSTGVEILDLLLGATKRLGSAIVMVTHDPMAAKRADRVLRLRDGLIVEHTEQLP